MLFQIFVHVYHTKILVHEDRRNKQTQAIHHSSRRTSTMYEYMKKFYRQQFVVTNRRKLTIKPIYFVPA